VRYDDERHAKLARHHRHETKNLQMNDKATVIITSLLSILFMTFHLTQAFVILDFRCFLRTNWTTWVQAAGACSVDSPKWPLSFPRLHSKMK